MQLVAERVFGRVQRRGAGGVMEVAHRLRSGLVERELYLIQPSEAPDQIQASGLLPDDVFGHRAALGREDAGGVL